MRGRARRVAAVVRTTILLVALGACGDDDDGGAASGATTTAGDGDGTTTTAAGSEFDSQRAAIPFDPCEVVDSLDLADLLGGDLEAGPGTASETSETYARDSCQRTVTGTDRFVDVGAIALADPDAVVGDLTSTVVLFDGEIVDDLDTGALTDPVLVTDIGGLQILWALGNEPAFSVAVYEFVDGEYTAESELTVAVAEAVAEAVTGAA